MPRPCTKFQNWDTKRKQKEDAQNKDRQIDEDLKRGTQQAQALLQEREANVRRRNSDSMRRAQSIDADLQRKRT